MRTRRKKMNRRKDNITGKNTEGKYYMKSKGKDKKFKKDILRQKKRKREKKL